MEKWKAGQHLQEINLPLLREKPVNVCLNANNSFWAQGLGYPAKSKTSRYPCKLILMIFQKVHRAIIYIPKWFAMESILTGLIIIWLNDNLKIYDRIEGTKVIANLGCFYDKCLQYCRVSVDKNSAYLAIDVFHFYWSTHKNQLI